MGCTQSAKKRTVAENSWMKSESKSLKTNVTDAKVLYDLIDENGDGKLSYREIRKILKVIGVEMTEQEAIDFLNALDLNGDGFIDFREFKKHLRQTMKQRSSDLVALFKFLDLDGDNNISHFEFIRGMDIMGEKITTDEVAQMMSKYFHTSGDKIDFEQFCLMFHKFV